MRELLHQHVADLVDEVARAAVADVALVGVADAVEGRQGVIGHDTPPSINRSVGRGGVASRPPSIGSRPDAHV